MKRRPLYSRVLRTSLVLSLAAAVLPVHAFAAIPALGYQEGEKSAPQEGSGTGEATYRHGEGASDPKIISQVDPEYTDKARKAKLSGSCRLSLIVETDGRPSNIRVTQSLGMGLDEKAIDAVKKWRFQPAMKDGHPVRYGPLEIEVTFRVR
jgi:TonB family protein